MTDKVLENRLRRVLARRGYTLMKSRRRDPRATDFGGYMVVRTMTNAVEAGGHPAFSLSLADVQRWIDAPA